ncbi:hypothetical protein BN1723_007653 [Verticillium longisporum]|uniref:USP domain-containing protein n=1 Tax=Verticillium longisporum TaxID=100787 RepID=A0A0G4NMI6_VERLO|nr:hypothetical protein BN1723_007653 [Verticillium longisporum]
MILFMREFQVINSGDSVAKLRKLLKNEELEQYGTSFTPEFIYQAIEPDKRFENMRFIDDSQRGHQQDAEEFFGLLLQSLDDECAKVMGAGGQQFYQQLPPQYQNGGMPTAYMQHYQQPYMRSPPAMQQFVPMAGVSVPQPYPRQHQQSPALATPYQPPPMPSAIAPHTPTSTHSSHIMAEASAVSSASPATSQIEQGQALAPAQEELVQPETAAPAPPVRQPTPEPAQPKEPFRAPLPWLSRPDLDFPKHTRVKRRKRAPLVSADKGVTLPSDVHGPLSESADHASTDAAVTDESQVSAGTASTVSAVSTPATPHANAASTSHDNSTETSTQNKRPVTSGSGASTSQSPAPSSSRPIVPVVPAIPKGSPKTTKTGAEASSEATKAPVAQDAPSETPSADVPSEEKAQEPSEEAPKSTPRAPPSSWSALFAKNAAAAAAAKNRNAQNGSAGQGTNGTSPDDADRPFDSTFPSDNSVNTIAAALRAYRVRNPEKVKYIEPRGLVNIGNMCYMNSEGDVARGAVHRYLVVFEFEESRNEVKSILVNVKAEWQKGGAEDHLRRS